jgi:hypothetical protein
MPWKDLVCLLTTIVGVALFLYSSNAYNPSVGWSGLVTVVAGLVSELGLQVYVFSRKKERG